MCTIVLLHRVRGDYPLVVAANRDEFYARPALPPRIVHPSPQVLSGVDVQAGGTWMGVTREGFFVGLTNQRTFHGSAPGLRSRGEVTAAALRAGSVDAARALVTALDPLEFNSFNLVYGDGHDLEVAYLRREAETITIESLSPGVHVLPNDRIDSPEFPKVGRVRALVSAHLDEPFEALSHALRSALADHVLPPLESVAEPPRGSFLSRELVRSLQAVCIHTEHYGTRSASLIALAAGEHRVHYAFADGPPCVTPFEPVDALFAPDVGL